ncbi:MAG: P1 family peptidase, partial [Bacteroidales bacterium]|nr:P1 family peptidase [Bacteroidales bacterium]
MKHIAFSEIAGVRVGNAQDEKAGTGVTVFRFTPAGRAAVEVFGGGPASRETETIATERNHPLNALVFSGGSAYGLAASDGVMRCLEAHGIGYDTGIAV